MPVCAIEFQCRYATDADSHKAIVAKHRCRILASVHQTPLSPSRQNRDQTLSRVNRPAPPYRQHRNEPSRSKSTPLENPQRPELTPWSKRAHWEKIRNHLPANIDRLRKQHHSSLPTLTKQNKKHLVIALINKQRRDNHSPNATSLTMRLRERMLLSPNPSFLTNLQAKNKQQEKEQEQQKGSAGRQGGSSRRTQQGGNRGRRQNKTRLPPAHIARWRKSKPCAILIPT